MHLVFANVSDIRALHEIIDPKNVAVGYAHNIFRLYIDHFFWSSLKPLQSCFKI
jgi:hypothetical protein